MIELQEQYIVDDEGQRQAVVLPIGQWKSVLEALEDLEDIRAYDRAKQETSDPIPFEDVMRDLASGS